MLFRDVHSNSFYSDEKLKVSRTFSGIYLLNSKQFSNILWKLFSRITSSDNILQKLFFRIYSKFVKKKFPLKYLFKLWRINCVWISTLPFFSIAKGSETSLEEYVCVFLQVNHKDLIWLGIKVCITWQAACHLFCSWVVWSLKRQNGRMARDPLNENGRGE